MVQWLRFCAADAEGVGSIPGQWTKTYMLGTMAKKVKKKKGKFRYRNVEREDNVKIHREDSHLQAKERGME